MEVTQLSFDQIPMTPTLIAYIGATAALGILAVVAWSYLAATVVRGVRAGEEPDSGWTAGALGAGLVLVGFIAGAGLSLAAAVSPPKPDSQSMFTAMGQLASVVFSLGYLFLLGGLAAGLPSLDEGDDEGKTHETEAAGLADFNGSNDSPV